MRIRWFRPAAAAQIGVGFQAAPGPGAQPAPASEVEVDARDVERVDRDDLLSKLRAADDEGARNVGAIPAWQAFGIAFLAPMLASSLTIPLDVSRTRMQMQDASNRLYRNALDCIWRIGKEEGLPGLTRGMPIQVLREATINMFKLGLYDPIVRLLPPRGEGGHHAPIAKRLVAGAVCGAIGSWIANPLDIVKTRAQAAGEAQVAPQAVLRQVVETQGVEGLWKGATPNMASSAASSAVMLCVYTTARDSLRAKFKLAEGPGLDVACSLLGAVLSTVAINPLVVVRTRVHALLKSGAAAKAPLAVAADVISREGPLGLYSGTSAALLMRVPNQILIFAFLEQMRRVLKRRAEVVGRQRRLRELFNRIDFDRSGKIDAMELLLAYVAATPRVPGQTDLEVVQAAMAKSEAMMARADTNGDRQISFEEFVAVAPEVERLTQRALRLAAFKAIDVKGDWSITRPELETAVHRLAPLSYQDSHMTKKEYDSLVSQGVDKLLRKADVNGDGRITFEDFEAVVEGMRELRNTHGLAAWARSRALSAN